MSGAQEDQVRVTRARAASKQPSLSQADHGKIARKAVKRAAVDENDRNGSNTSDKRRAVLGDVSNLCAQDNASAPCVARPKPQVTGENGGGGKGRRRIRKNDVEALVVNGKVQAENSVENAVENANDPGVSHIGLEGSRPVVNPAGSVSLDQQPPLNPGNRSPERPDVPSCFRHTDIDSDNADPQMCSTYVQDIYRHLRIAELKKRPSASLMEAVQRDITLPMRAILIDWLVEVAEEYKLVPDTLYLTVAYLDRFISANPVYRQKLQLLGVSCMLIASKYEEICPPPVDEFCYITDNTYSKEEMLAMERKILNFLQFEVTIPTTKTFLRRFIRAAQAGNKAPTLHMEFLCNYLAELTLVECNFLQYLPSLVAASAVFLSRLTLDHGTHPWNLTLQHYTGYKPSSLKECVCAIYDLQLSQRCCTLTAIREKYRQHKFKCVANLVPPAAIPHQFFEDVGK